MYRLGRLLLNLHYTGSLLQPYLAKQCVVCVRIYVVLCAGYACVRVVFGLH